MITALLVKMLATALVVIAVAVTVGNLGPRLGGIVAGTPIVLGPGYFFMLREQPAAFIAEAAVSSIHALTATLAFMICYILTGQRLGAVRGLTLAVLVWLPTALLFAGLLPGGLFTALSAYVAVFLVVRIVERRLHLPQPRVSAPGGWFDLFLRGVLAGLLVGFAATLADGFGPLISGVMLGFPIGLITIGLTLHQRYGAPVARATMAAAQPALFSLIAFTAVVGFGAERLAPMWTFTLALIASIGVSAALLAVSQFRARVSVA